MTSLPTLPDDVLLAVVGLGYVGLPLAVECGRCLDVIGFDINQTRVAELAEGQDRTLEVDDAELASATRLRFTSDAADLDVANVYIVTTPTPIDEAKQPDMSPVLTATETIAGALRPGDVVIYQSTVYPGATEERCVPVLEEVSGLRFNEDFFVGYSPERINPGDKQHRLPLIVKVTLGSTPEIAIGVDIFDPWAGADEARRYYGINRSLSASQALAALGSRAHRSRRRAPAGVLTARAP